MQDIIERSYRAGQLPYCRILYCLGLLILFILFLLPAEQIGGAGINDKLIHFCIFFCLYIPGHFVFSRLHPGKLLTGLVIYGMMTECGQALVPYREFSLADWFADIGGLTSGMLCILLLCKISPSSNRYLRRPT